MCRCRGLRCSSKRCCSKWRGPALDDLESFDIRVHLELITARRVLYLARRFQLQGHDALYFDLAKTLMLPLATLDDGHRQAAKQFGVRLFLPT